MRWIALAIAVFAITLWAHTYAHDWNLPNWLGHIAYGIMFVAAVIGIFKPSTGTRIVDPVVGPTTLQPGDKGTLRVEAPPMEGEHETGLHLFEVTVKSNDPVEPEKKVYLTADFETAE